MFDPAKKLPEYSKVPKKTDKLHRICLSSQFFFMKGVINFAAILFTVGFKVWMQNDFIAHKDIYGVNFMLIGIITCKITEGIIVALGKTAKVWHLYCEEMLIKTKDVGIKSRTELIAFLYNKKSQEGKKDGKAFEVNDFIVDEVMNLMGDEGMNDDQKTEELSKFIKSLGLEKLINLDKLFEKIANKQKDVLFMHRQDQSLPTRESLAD